MKHTVKLTGKLSRWLCAIALAAAMVFTFVSCGDFEPPDTSVNGTRYAWTDTDGVKYDLSITEGGAGRSVTSGNYILIITLVNGTVITSSGRASGTAANITLTTSAGGNIGITISGTTLTVTTSTAINGHPPKGGTVFPKDEKINYTQADLQGTWLMAWKNNGDDVWIRTVYSENKVSYIYSDTHPNSDFEDTFTVSGNKITRAYDNMPNRRIYIYDNKMVIEEPGNDSGIAVLTKEPVKNVTQADLQGTWIYSWMYNGDNYWIRIVFSVNNLTFKYSTNQSRPDFQSPFTVSGNKIFVSNDDDPFWWIYIFGNKMVFNEPTAPNGFIAFTKEP